MRRSVGIFLALLLGALTIFMILWVWGVVHINFLNVLKGGASIAILIASAVLFVVVYGMFFWKGGGRQLSLREQRELNERQSSQRSDA